MQQHSSVPKRKSIVTTPDKKTDETSEAVQIRQLTAALWLERCLNQIQRRLNDCLVFDTQKSDFATTTSKIFQTVVKELSDAIGTGSVAIALADTKASNRYPASKPVCQICYVATTQQARPDSAVILATLKTVGLELGVAIALEDLQQLQTQKPKSAWSIHDDQDLICWLIADTSPPPSDAESLEALKSKLKPQLLERTARQCAIALTQLRQLQAASLRYQHLEARNQELLRSNQLKSEFLANTSHEIRTPLSSILGFTRLLQAQGYNPNNLRHQDYLNIIMSSGQHLLAVINDILDLSKIEANQLEVQYEAVNVPDLCRSVIALVKEKASDKGLELRLDIDTHATSLVADSLRLKQMLFNLLSNGLKFTSQGTVGLQVKHRGVFLDFTVWDTGIGISKEQQHQLFQPYSQIANAVASRQEGTGLGLALTQKLAELHGGRVEVHSELNQGSRFTIVLPLTPAVVEGEQGKWELEVMEEKEEMGRWGDRETQCGDSKHIAPGNAPAPTPQCATRMTGKYANTPSVSTTATASILLVEDHLHNAKLITTYLSKFGGYQVNWVKNAAQFWQALKEPYPALILMDIHLPDVDGIKLIKQLQAQEQLRTIPVIAQTAMAMKGDRETCLAAGAIEYISKPIDLNLLANLVSKYTNGT